MKTARFATFLGIALTLGCANRTHLTVPQVRQIADSAARAAGYAPGAWIQQFVIYQPANQEWWVSYSNYPPHRSYTGFKVRIRDDTAKAVIEPPPTLGPPH